MTDAPTWESRAHRLAQEITWIHAKALAEVDRSNRSGPRMTFKQRTVIHYDSHAAFELAEWICRRLSPTPETTP